MLANLRVAYDTTPDWTVDASIRNLLDANYEIEDGYHAAVRSSFGDVRVRF